MIRVAALAIVAAALVSADRDPLAGRIAGAPVKCVSLSATADGPTIVDARTILYRQGSRYYRTGPRDACPSLRPFATLIVEVHGGQLCSGDLFRVLDANSSIPGGACRFADFTPYAKAK